VIATIYSFAIFSSTRGFAKVVLAGNEGNEAHNETFNQNRHVEIGITNKTLPILSTEQPVENVRLKNSWTLVYE